MEEEESIRGVHVEVIVDNGIHRELGTVGGTVILVFWYTHPTKFYYSPCLHVPLKLTFSEYICWVVYFVPE